jgi:phage recombination protein Bet
MQIANISENILLTKDVKRTFEENYIKMLFEKHRELPKSDIIEFVHKAQQTGANPSLNQIYLIERNTNVNGQWRKVGSVVFSYNFIQAIANQTKEYHGYESAISVQEKFDPFTLETKKTLCCHVVVKRNGHNYPYTAFFDEYVQTTKDGKPMGLWASKPYIMLEKCAISGALRRAFPEALSGIYCEEEMESASSEFDKLDKTKIIEATATEKIEKHIDLMGKINDRENGN